MDNLLAEFRYRRSLISNMNYEAAALRLSGFLAWLESNETTAAILAKITNDARVNEMLKKSDFHHPPSASSPEDFAVMGLYFMREVKSGEKLLGFSHKYGIRPSYQTASIQAMTDEIVNRYIEPAIDYIKREIEDITRKNNAEVSGVRFSAGLNNYPPEINISLQKFRGDHLDNRKTAFIMMQFGATKAHQSIVEAIKTVFDKHGIAALRADEKEYHSSLLSNVLTYIYGCNVGVAVFERIEADKFNPNVSFEVGYMRALNKPICLLKDRTMTTLQTDLLGELYKAFDPQDPKNSIPNELEKWLKDKDIIN